MANKNNLQAKGLYTDPNLLSGVPEGALVEADNVIIDRGSIIQPRRGFNKYGNTFGVGTDTAKQLLSYKNRILIHYGNKLIFNNNPHNLDVDGDFQEFDGTFTETEPGLRIKGAESNKNFYFTTDDGIKKISSKSASEFTTAAGYIVDAGAVKALDLTGSLNTQTEGFLPANSKVAYKLVWGYTDANSVVVLGSPSSRLVITNFSDQSANVNLEFVIPNSVTNNYFYQIYRTSIFTAALAISIDDIDPGDEMNLIIEDFPSVGEFASSLVELTDITPDDFRKGGLFLYTNQNSGEGVNQSNEPPPIAKDLTLYQNTMFYSNTETRASTTLSLLGISSLVSGVSSISIDDGINPVQEYTFVGEKEVTDIKFGAYNGTAPADLDGKYYLFNSASNDRKYYMWYDDTKTTQKLDFSGYIGTLPEDLDGQAVVIYTPTDRNYYIWYDATGTTVDPGNLNELLATYIPIKVDLSQTLSQVGSSYDIGNPVQITASSHELQTNDKVTVTNSSGTSIDGEYVVTRIDANNFTIPVDNSAGSGGTLDWELVYTKSTVARYSSEAVITNNLFNDYDTVYSNGDDFLDIETESFDTSSINPNDNSGQGFIYTITTPDNNNPGNDTGTYTDVNGRVGIRVSVARNVSTKAEIADASAAALVSLDAAGDFDVAYTTLNDFFTISNTNNGNCDDAEKATINPIGNLFDIEVTTQGDGEDSALNEILLSAAATPAQQIDETARSIVNIINKNSSEVVNAFYISGTTDIPGQFLLEVRDIGTASFSVTANDASTGALFNPPLPPVVGAEAVLAEAEIKPNRLFFSKLQQPEAVPILNFIDIGPEDEEISRILALRESLFILKTDGIYRLTGINGAFTVDSFDNSTKIISPDTAVVLNNQIYCLTNQGVAVISDTGVDIISKRLDNVFQVLTSSNYNFKYSSFGVSYETDRSYILFLPSSVNDTVATQAYRYNSAEDTWTRWTLAKTCGLVNGFDDKLYFGANDENFIERERKLFKRTDYADRDFALDIPANSVNGDLVTISQANIAEIGDAIVQEQLLTVNHYNQLLAKLDLDPFTGSPEEFTVDFSSYTGTVPDDLHGKFFIMYSASDAQKYAVFYDSFDNLPYIDPNTFNEVIGATQIRVDISNALSKIDVANITQNTIKTITQDFIISYITSNEFFNAITNKNGNTTDPFDSVTTPIGNGFSIVVTTQGFGDYVSSLQSVAGDNLKTKVNDLALKLDNDPSVNDTNYLATTLSFPDTFQGTQDSFNAMVIKVNLDSGVLYSNYSLSEGTSEFEVLVFGSQIATPNIEVQFSVNFIEGPITLYKGIKSNILYAPETFGDPSILKHVREGTFMFENATFTRGEIGYKSDLSPGIESISFNKSGKGDWGAFIWSSQNWGGGFSGVPLRTYIPRSKQRCRYLQAQYKHSSAREKWGIFGISYTLRGVSSRAYRG